MGLLPRELEIACIDPHQTGFVGKGSDHLQLITFWPSRAPGGGSAAVRFFLARSALLQPAHSVCVSLSAFYYLSWSHFGFGHRHDFKNFVLFTSLSSATLGKLLTHMCLCHRVVYSDGQLTKKN